MANARARTIDAAFRIESLPGVGPALAGKLRSAYGSDEDFHEACLTLDLDPLLAVEGISERRAFDLVAAVRREGTMELAGTERVRDVRRELEDQLASYAHTSYGRRYVRLLPTLRDAKKIAAHAERVMHMRDQAERLDRPTIAAALESLRPLRDVARVPGLHRVIVVDDTEQEFELRQRGLDRHCRIVAGREARREYERGDLVLYAGDNPAGIDDVETALSVERNAPLWEFVPEVAQEFVELNRATLEALRTLAHAVGRPTVATVVLDKGNRTKDATVADLRACAQTALAHAQQTFQQTVTGMSLTGAQVLELLTSGSPGALSDARAAAVKAGRARFQELVGKDWDVFLPGLPLRLDDEEVERLDAERKSTAAVEAFRRRVAAAEPILDARQALDQEMRDWLRFDVEFALGAWTLDMGARPARTSDRLRFEGAAHTRLLRGPAEPQRISYNLGGADPIAVLTGANSGGKSTLLELVAQILVLHHWGLPVPATDAEVPVLDEVLFFGGSRGVSAGAFETFLGDLFPPLTRPGRRLLLLDEVESMTELEAAGRILGVFLGEVRRTGALCVLVTHLPTEVLAHAKVAVRIDGIDAVGLDDEFNLIVDRQPKLGHRARSTPELILRRVHARSSGPAKDLYRKILESWS